MCAIWRRLSAVSKQVQQGSVPQSKAEQVRDDVEDAMAKMEQTRVLCSYSHSIVAIVKAINTVAVDILSQLVCVFVSVCQSVCLWIT